MSSSATVEEKIEAQEKYIEKTGLPRFAPYDGRCFRCGRQIYEKISLERARNELITGCPYCNRSYVS